MCIIVAKDKKANLPKSEYLQNCFNNNSDGAGFMYTDNNNVIIDKGYMTYKSFKKHYDKLCKKYNDFKDKSLVIHFRIGTSGNNTQANCHPFTIGKSTSDLKKIYNTCKLGVVHNGIISDYVIKGTNEYDLSDTMNFIDTFLTPLYKGYKNFYKDKNIMEGIKNLITSKLCLLDTNDDLYFVGDFTEEEGIKYSNNTYSYNWYKSTNNYVSNYYDDYTEYNKWLDEKEKEGKFSKYDKIPKNWYYLTGDGNLKRIDSEGYYYDEYTCDVLKETYTGNLVKIMECTCLYDKNLVEKYGVY